MSSAYQLKSLFVVVSDGILIKVLPSPLLQGNNVVCRHSCREECLDGTCLSQTEGILPRTRLRFPSSWYALGSPRWIYRWSLDLWTLYERTPQVPTFFYGAKLHCEWLVILGCVSLTFYELSTILSGNLCITKIVLLIRISSCTRLQYQLEIRIINVISGIVYFRKIILESLRSVSETTPGLAFYA